MTTITYTAEDGTVTTFVPQTTPTEVPTETPEVTPETPVTEG